MEIEITSTEVASAADAKRSEAPAETVETNESVDSNESETTEESETSENDSDSNESASDDSSQEDESQDKEEEEGKEKAELPKGVKKRFNRFKRKLSEKDQEIEYLRGELFKKGQAPEAKEVQTQVEVKASDRPNSDDFENHEDFVEALTDWKLEQRETLRAAKDREVQAKTAFEKQQTEHGRRVQAFKESAKDYDDVIGEFIEDHGTNGDFMFSPGLTTLVYESESGPAVIYELAKTPEELLRINSLSPLDAAREFGKLEARLSKSDPSVKKLTTTKAPAPPSLLGGKTDKAVKKSIFDPGLPFEDYERLRKEQLKQRGY